MPKKERKTLMTNYDPKPTLLTLCQINDPIITHANYKKKYEQLFNDGQPISRGHADAHFFLLRQFQLIKEIKPAQYKLSSTGELICKLLCENREQEYQKALKTILLTTENKDFFKDFRKFVKRSKSLEQIKKKFGRIISNGEEREVEMYRTLIAWSEEANLITKHEFKRKVKTKLKSELYVAATPKSKTQKYSLKEFWNELKCIYKEIQAASGFGSKMFYIQIGELRLRVSAQLGFWDTKEFDYHLTKLLESKAYRLYIRLHGAPTHAYEFMQTFEFRNKKYPLISLVVVR